ncbi:MAG: glucosidase [Prochlorococcus sp.]
MTAARSSQPDSLPAEIARRQQRDQGLKDWDLWGTYLSDRQWGTVREDYSADGDAWNHFPFEHSHLRSYRWGEDGLLGWCDRNGLLCFAPVLWNGEDDILKERLFGLSNHEGNHGEDIKDYMFHLAGTPTGSYAKALYRYPHQRFPYDRLRAENKARDRSQPEYELIETGVFNDDRYFDVVVEYAKSTPEDILICITISNQGPEDACLHLLPHLWLRNTWAWGDDDADRAPIQLQQQRAVTPQLATLASYELCCQETGTWLFTENETNTDRLFNKPLKQPYVKDAFHRYLIDAEASAVNPSGEGTKSALHLQHCIPARGKWLVNLRLRRRDPSLSTDPFSKESFDDIFNHRRDEWNGYLETIAPGLCRDDRSIHAAATAGLFWGRKFYNWYVARWLRGDRSGPKPAAQRWRSENAYWKSLRAMDVISMPDSWEYPYFCQWDLMFHAVAFAELDPGEAKRQAMLLRDADYSAPNAQTPAYEWALSDTNPPIGAWAALRIFQIEKRSCRKGDTAFLRTALRKLLFEYGWWANRTDRNGDNLFEGGFLGLDNIAIFDRRYPLKDGSTIQQSDGTAWMGMLSLNLLEISTILSADQPEYCDCVQRFSQDFLHLTHSLNSATGRGYVNWDEQDGFYYDVIKKPNGSTDHLRTRSVSGLIPLLAIASFDAETVSRLPSLDIGPYLKKLGLERGQAFDSISHLGSWHKKRLLLSIVPPERLQRILKRVFDEDEFLSEYGIRSLSKTYEKHPYSYHQGSDEATISYTPADSPIGMFGGNSNWRGPIWFPINFLLIEALQKWGFHFGNDFQMEFPTGSGRKLTLWEISLELQDRLVGIFRKNEHGKRAFNGKTELFQDNVNWQDLILFNEYFNGDNGAGVGASHQTGWTAIVTKMITQLRRFERYRHTPQ